MKTTTQMFIDDQGNHMTRMWYVKRYKGADYQCVKVIPSTPSQIRKPRETKQWMPPVEAVEHRTRGGVNSRTTWAAGLVEEGA